MVRKKAPCASRYLTASDSSHRRRNWSTPYGCPPGPHGTASLHARNPVQTGSRPPRLYRLGPRSLSASADKQNAGPLRPTSTGRMPEPSRTTLPMRSVPSQITSPGATKIPPVPVHMTVCAIPRDYLPERSSTERKKPVTCTGNTRPAAAPCTRRRTTVGLSHMPRAFTHPQCSTKPNTQPVTMFSAKGHAKVTHKSSVPAIPGLAVPKTPTPPPLQTAPPNGSPLHLPATRKRGRRKALPLFLLPPRTPPAPAVPPSWSEYRQHTDPVDLADFSDFYVTLCTTQAGTHAVNCTVQRTVFHNDRLDIGVPLEGCWPSRNDARRALGLQFQRTAAELTNDSPAYAGSPAYADLLPLK